MVCPPRWLPRTKRNPRDPHKSIKPVLKKPSHEAKQIHKSLIWVAFSFCTDHQAGKKGHMDTHLVLTLTMIVSAVSEKDIQYLRISIVCSFNTASFIDNSS